MNIRSILAAVVTAALPLAATATTLVVPAAGTGPGAYGSQWQSELTMHNAAPRSVEIELSLRQGTNEFGPATVAIGPRSTVSISDVVHESFGLDAGTGALLIEASERDARSLVVTSRAFNTSAAAEYGQDIPAIAITAAAQAGEIAAVNGPATAAGNRLNFGILAVTPATVTWQLVRADGTIAGSRELTYVAGEQAQYSSGIETLLSLVPADGDVIYARINEGKAIVYGSIVNTTGDPTFVPGVRTRDDIIIVFNGLDLDQDGTIDMPDADGDGVIDTPLVVYTSTFPNSFDIVATGEFGEDVALEIVSSPAYVKLETGGYLQIAASGDLKGKDGEIRVLATSGNSSTTLVIPVLFK